MNKNDDHWTQDLPVTKAIHAMLVVHGVIGLAITLFELTPFSLD